MSTATERKPECSFRHRQLEAAVWKNRGQNGVWYNVSLAKSWQANEEWKKTSASFGLEDLLPATKLLDWADFTIGNAVENNLEAESDKTLLSSKKRGLLECAVWHKVTEDGDSYYVSLKRSYKDGNQWKDVLVWLGSGDLLSAGRILTRSFDAIDDLYLQRNTSFVDTAKQTFDATESVAANDEIPF